MNTALRERRLGIALVAGAAVMWSLAGIFTRLVSVDVWTILLWRAVFGGSITVLYMVYEHRSRTLHVIANIGWLGVAATCVAALSMVAYISALKLTSVANVLIVYAMTPFFAAGIAYVWTGERATRRTLLASAIALVGVAIMVSGSAQSGRLAGDALALVMTFTFAGIIVMARRDPTYSMTPVCVTSSFLCIALCWPLSQPGLPSPHDLVVLALFGFCTIGLALILYMAGARRLPAAETGFINLIDTVLGPLWVWLAFAETPVTAALIGGGIVMAAVVWYMAAELRGARSRAT